jgi:hypothetical protein
MKRQPLPRGRSRKHRPTVVADENAYSRNSKIHLLPRILLILFISGGIYVAGVYFATRPLSATLEIQPKSDNPETAILLSATTGDRVDNSIAGTSVITFRIAIHVPKTKSSSVSGRTIDASFDNVPLCRDAIDENGRGVWYTVSEWNRQLLRGRVQK